MSRHLTRVDTSGIVKPEVRAVVAAVGEGCGVELAVIPWREEDEGIEVVICGGDDDPTTPVWEVVHLVRGEGDCLAVHPWSTRAEHSMDESAEWALSLGAVQRAAAQMACFLSWTNTGLALEAPTSGAPVGRGTRNRGEWT